MANGGSGGGGGGGGAGGVAIVAIVLLVVLGVLAGGYMFMRGGAAPVHSIAGSVSTPAGPITGNAVTH